MKSTTWIARLNNGETVKGGSPGSWMELRNKTLNENLSLVSLSANGREVDSHPGVESYFTFFKVWTNFKNKPVTKVCHGSFRKNGKARLVWETLDPEDDKVLIEIVSADHPDSKSWKEIAIPVTCSQKKK